MKGSGRQTTRDGEGSGRGMMDSVPSGIGLCRMRSPWPGLLGRTGWALGHESNGKLKALVSPGKTGPS